MGRSQRLRPRCARTGRRLIYYTKATMLKELNSTLFVTKSTLSETFQFLNYHGLSVTVTDYILGNCHGNIHTVRPPGDREVVVAQG